METLEFHGEWKGHFSFILNLEYLKQSVGNMGQEGRREYQDVSLEGIVRFPFSFFFFFVNFYFYFILLYNTVLVLPYIDMNQPRVYMSSQS